MTCNFMPFGTVFQSYQEDDNERLCGMETWPRGYKTFFSCSTQLCMKFFLLINVKMPTIVNILTFMSGKNII